MELLQSVVPSIYCFGAVIQWTANITEHTHVKEIKVPAQASNNQNYYSQIACHLNRLDRCFRFDLTEEQIPLLDDEDHENHELDAKIHTITEYTPTHPIIDYFAILSAFLKGSNPHSQKPFHTFAIMTSAFHLAAKPLLWLTAMEAATKYDLPDLIPTISVFLAQ